MKKMNNVKQTPPRCPFSNTWSRAISGFFKLWGAGEKS